MNTPQIPTPVQIVPDLTDDFTKRFYEKFENRISVKDFAAIAKDVYRNEIASYQRAIRMRHKKQEYLNEHWPTWYAKYMKNYNGEV